MQQVRRIEKVLDMVQDDVRAQFQRKLRELFRCDDSEFNWGVYRILNQRNRDIDDFIQKDIPSVIDEKIQVLNEKSLEQIEEEMKEMEQQARNLGVEVDTLPKYQTLLDQKRKMAVSDTVETRVYNHLLSFFSRYFLNGDFISRFYFKDDQYVVPYDGSEVYMHWATKGQYYVKSSEKYDRLSVAVGNVSVVFRVVEASQEKGNIKKRGNKVYTLLEGSPFDWNEETKELMVNFVHVYETDEIKNQFPGKTADRQNAINESMVNDIRMELMEREKWEEIDLLHPIKKFQRRYTEDFFIHKDLKEFLSRELEYYIQNEVLNVNMLISAHGEIDKNRVVMSGVFKEIAERIIERLAAVENLKKKVWEKKKFVLRTDYCLTLDKILDKATDDFLKKIMENEEQVAEWEELFGVVPGQEKQKRLGDFSDADSNVLFLRNNPYLVLDTKFFDDEFKWELLCLFENLDEEIGGVMIKSENWQALNLMQGKYREKIKCCYIDPPYNTGNDGFSYKDVYQHSSWLSMLSDRTQSVLRLLREDGLFYASIDDNELHHLRRLCDTIIDEKSFVGTLTWISTTQPDNIGSARFGLQKNFEYILLYGKCKRLKLPPFNLKKSEKKPNYPHKGRFGPCRFEIIERAFEGAYARRTMRFPILDQKPREGKQWQIGKKKAEELEKKGCLEIVDGIVKRAIYPEDEKDKQSGFIPFWAHIKDVGTSQKGKAELTDIIGRGHGFDTVKPVSLLTVTLLFDP